MGNKSPILFIDNWLYVGNSFCEAFVTASFIIEFFLYKVIWLIKLELIHPVGLISELESLPKQIPFTSPEESLFWLFWLSIMDLHFVWLLKLSSD